MGRLCRAGVEALECVADAHEVELDGFVHGDEAIVVSLAGLGQEIAGVLELVAVDVEEVVGGEEVVTGQAGVGVGQVCCSGRPQ